MKIRYAKESELSGINNLFIESYNTYPYFEKWDKKISLKKLKKYFKDGKFLVSLNKDEITGVLVFTTTLWDKGTHYTVEEFFVKPELQKQGIGTELINKLFIIAKKKKIRAISLLSNEKSTAYKIYKNLGFEKQMVYLEKKI